MRTRIATLKARLRNLRQTNASSREWLAFQEEVALARRDSAQVLSLLSELGGSMTTRMVDAYWCERALNEIAVTAEESLVSATLS